MLKTRERELRTSREREIERAIDTYREWQRECNENYCIKYVREREIKSNRPAERERDEKRIRQREGGERDTNKLAETEVY